MVNRQHTNSTTASAGCRAAPRALAALVGLVALCAALAAPASAIPHAMDPPTVAQGEAVAVAPPAGLGGVGNVSFSMEAGGMVVSLDSDPASRVLLQTRQGGKVFWCFAESGTNCDRPAVMLTTPGDFSDHTTPLTEDVVLELGPMIDGTSMATQSQLRVVARDVARMVWSAGMAEVPTSSPDPTAPRSVVPGASVLATKDSDDLIVELQEGADLVVENSLVIETVPTVNAASFLLSYNTSTTVETLRDLLWSRYMMPFPTFSDDSVVTYDPTQTPRRHIKVGGTLEPERIYLDAAQPPSTTIKFTNVAGRTLHLVGSVQLNMIRLFARNATLETVDPCLYVCMYKPPHEASFLDVPYEFVRLSDDTIGGRTEHTYERMFTLEPNEEVRIGYSYEAGNDLKTVATLGRFEFRELH